MPRSTTTGIAFAICLTASVVRGQASLPSCRQILIVTTPSWPATHGGLTIFERDRRARFWRRAGPEIPVILGQAGMGWGRGFIDTAGNFGPVKKEGDNRAPAGVFRLGLVFGRAHENPGTKMPYLRLTPDIVAVDDQRSRFYNQLVNQSEINTPDWRSAERMILADHRYDLGVVVEHNIPPKAGAGSCIFLHVWKTPATLTTGCTAMAEGNLLKIIRWLDPARHPLLVQMPRPVYEKLSKPWRLPQLP